MLNMLRFLLISLTFFIIIPANAQRTEQDIKQKEKELQKLRSDIEIFEKKLEESESKEKSTLVRLDNLEHQSALIKKLIQKLHEEELSISAEIDTAKKGINSLENSLQFLKSHYANYVRSVYKNGRIYDFELLFSSKSINQLLIRIQYLKNFSKQRAKDLQDIAKSKYILEQKNEILQIKLQEERQLLAEKKKEEVKLKKKYSERQTVLKKIRKDKKTYKQELARKTEAYKKIENLIADLVEKERIRKEREDAERRERELAEARDKERLKTTIPYMPIPDASTAAHTFERRKGKLRWPVTNGTIHSRFGNQIHPVLKTVTQNTGIDIATPNGSDVFAVADGEVSVLSFIPGFGNILILNHYHGYRTVYAHLSDVYIKEGNKVKEGAIIGKSGDTISGPILHFEIWKEREKQNPELWLVRAQ